MEEGYGELKADGFAGVSVNGVEGLAGQCEAGGIDGIEKSEYFDVEFGGDVEESFVVGYWEEVRFDVNKDGSGSYLTRSWKLALNFESPFDLHQLPLCWRWPVLYF